jgi:hypothetical protein
MNTTDKLNQFPQELQDKIASADFLVGIGKLEEKYHTKLISKFIKLVVGDLSLEKLDSSLVAGGLTQSAARMIAQRFHELLGTLKLQFPDAFKKANSDGIRIPNVNRATQSDERLGFHFSKEDEEEIADYKKQPIAGGNNLDYAGAVDKIMEEFNYKTGDDVLKKRLSSVIQSRLKDIRDEMETVEILKRSKKIGGMEMADDRVASLVAIIKTSAERGITEKIREVEVEVESNVISDDFIEKKESSIKNTESGAVIEDEDGLPVINVTKMNQGGLKGSRPVKVQSVPQPQPVSHPIKRVIGSKMVGGQSKKPKLADVQYSTNAVGPIEELELMTLIDFRRLASTPEDIIAKVSEKIMLLEEDSYAQRIEGVSAWQKNEVNKFYRLLGQESLKQGKGVESIIDDRLAKGKPTLSFDEFNAIMKLNGDLRF